MARLLGMVGFVWFALLMHGAWASHFIFNNPYPQEESTQRILYTSFTEQPKTLDPAKSYVANEAQFTAQIYEPLLQFDYYLRPYQLVPLIAASMPVVRFYDKDGRLLSNESLDKVAKSTYTIQIRRGVFYQPHPAFAKDSQGRYRYYPLPRHFLDQHQIKQLNDFKYTGTRELTIDDYIYQIKRLANPAINSPIYGLLSNYILGFREYGQTLPLDRNRQALIDLRRHPLSGVRKIDSATMEITIKGHYKQFLFWLAMLPFSPIPWEVDRFYAQEGMIEKNIGLSWYPVGTGPFLLRENNPNRRMVLERNINYREDYFPTSNNPDDKAQGLLKHAGQRIPLIDKAVYTLEKESIPHWTKFLQGYYDSSAISADSFDQAIQIIPSGEVTLSPEMEAKGIYLEKTIEPSVFYLGFNMRDKIVGGTSQRARLLRQAISIAVDYDEYISIFRNGRGFAAQGPLPPGIFGFREGELGINPYVYRWKNNALKRRSIHEARALMSEAGYPNGIDPLTKKPLTLTYDVSVTGSPDDKAQLDWMRKQLSFIGIDLDVRSTLYNRFQEKMRTGSVQIFSWGWGADYPDPENFMFLLYGPNGKVDYGGENAANYNNPAFDQLFDKMKNMENNAARLALIDQMLEMVRRDSPWIWGMNSESFVLRHTWVSPTKVNALSWNTLKYDAVNIVERNALRRHWNSSILWPIGVFLMMLLVGLIPFVWVYRQKQQHRASRLKS